MPEAGQEITYVKVNNQILISGLDFRLISYEIDNIAYTYVGQYNEKAASRCITSSKEKLYLFEGKQIFEMTKQYEVFSSFL